MSKEDVSITYENNIFYCTKNNTKWISVDGEKWYAEEKRIAELESKIADIKANCDLAIEGRDIKIKELELELTVEKDQHQEEINLHLHAEDYIKELEKENAELRKNGFTVSAMTEQQLKVAIEKGKLLEKENKKVKQGCHKWFMRWREVKREELEVFSKIAELEKENAELKAEIENDRDLSTVAYMQGAENQKKKDGKQLAKAKDLIENIIRVTWGEGWNYSLDWKVKAEQFLKEIE